MLISEQVLELTGDGHGHHIPGTPYLYRHGWQKITGPAPPSVYGAADSKSVNSNPDGSWKPERLALHQKIIGEALEGHPPEEHPRAIFLGGGPASGKSSIASARPDGTVMIAADDIMGQLPEYQQMITAGNPLASTFSHREAAEIADQLQDTALKRKISFTLDGTGDRDYKTQASRVAAAHAAGYQAVGEYVTTDTEEAVRRAKLRAQQTGRMVPESAIRAIHASVSRIFEQLTYNDVFDHAELWDNNGSTPQLVGERPPGGHWNVDDPQAWRRFLAKEQSSGTG